MIFRRMNAAFVSGAMIVALGLGEAMAETMTVDEKPPSPVVEGYLTKRDGRRCYVRLLDDGGLRRSESCFRKIGLGKAERWMRTAETVRFLGKDGVVVLNLNIQRPGFWRSEGGAYSLSIPAIPADIPMSK